jgi:hypothetical protein
MAEMGMLADMPQELKDGGGLYETIYENPLSRARKAEQAGGFYQMLSGVAPLIQMDPENNSKAFLQSFPFERVLKGLSDIHGVPEAWAASEDEVAQSKATASALAKQSNALEVGTSASEIVKNLSAAAPAAQPAGGASA